MPGPWDEEADVVVVGYGGAGASAAIAAAPTPVLRCSSLKRTKAAAIPNSLPGPSICPEHSQSAEKDLLALSFGALEESIVDSFLEWTARNNDFVRELGGDVEVCPPGATFPSLPGAEAMVRYRLKGAAGERGGESLWIFQRATSKRVGSAFFAKLPLRSLCAWE